MACTTVALVLWLAPWLLRADLFSEDATQHVFWLYRLFDSELFPSDPSIEYFSAPSSAPYGYRFIYRSIGNWVDVLAAAEWLSVLLLTCSALLAWRLGRAIGEEDSEMLGLLAVVSMLVLLPLVDLLPPMAFQRTFALPLILLSVWALTVRRYVWVGLTWLMAAFLYPVVIPVLGLSAGVVFLADLVRERRLPDRWLWNGLLGAAALSIALLQGATADGIGPMVTFEQAMAMPEFGPGGRQSLFGEGLSSYWFGHHRNGLGWSPWLVVSMLVSLAIAASSGRLRMIPAPVWAMAIVGVALWFLARLVMFDLYLPNRHSRWALAPFAIIVFSVAAHSLIRAACRQGAQENGALSRSTVKAIAYSAPLVVLASLLPQALEAWGRPIDADLERVYEFVATTPKDTLVAAHPDVADDVPLRTRRSVLASSEASLSFMLGYYERLKPRLEASLRAAYASSWEDLDHALQPYGVDMVIAGPPVWSAPGYYRPFDTLVSDLRAKGERDGFVLLSPAPDRIVFQSGQWYVVRVMPWDAADE